ncbi:hypothetical protein EIP91_001413 [Steccherinum ochraceum]|uniref:Uncharacterized protein n=1 Tax=Steccherinum ochraceum TaxID=92696 RepID=A0A4R0RUL9_9APHY|nr:hypothetical protein EIP91_001413 [Steccherinum ochraceum]
MTMLFNAADTMFPQEKALGGEDAVQAVLADVPLYAAGILALGMFTVFLIMQRDNSQVLLRFGADAKPEQRWSTVTALITTREIFLALSFGLRLLFFWFFVAQPPPGEKEPDNGQLHNGSWEKWGLVGVFLKWALVLMCAAITLLQILYRTVAALSKFGPVYEVACTMEIVITACFMLKIFLNGYLVVVTILWSETVLGRLLDAVEDYILIVTIAVFTFQLVDGPPPLRIRRANRSSSFHALGPGLGQVTSTAFRISRSPFGELQEPQRDKPRTHSRGGSIADRLSSLMPRALSQRGVPYPTSPTGDKLWNQYDAERGVSPSLYSPTSHADLDRKSRRSFDESPYEPKESAKWQDPLFSTVLGRVSPTPGEMLADAALRPSASLSNLKIPPRIFSSPTTPSSRGDSPIYGLNGRHIPAPAPARDAIRSPLSDNSRSSQTIPESNRSSSYSTILRQQAELDRSIANLRLLARDTIDGATLLAADDGKPASAATQSDFSLSNFPAPPWRMSSDSEYTARESMGPVVMISRADSVKTLKQAAAEDGGLELVPPKMPAVAEHTRNVSVPFSDNDDPLPTGNRVRVDSEGTQYEITSFIGHLTHKKDTSIGTNLTASSTSGSPPRNRALADTSSEVSSIGDFPSPPRIITGRPVGLPSRPRLNVGVTQTLSPLVESATSPQDEFENPRSAPSPSS